MQIIFPFTTVIKCLVEVGSSLKYFFFATQYCNQAADMGTHSRWQAWNSNTAHRRARKDRARMESVRVCFNVQGFCLFASAYNLTSTHLRRQRQQWPAAFFFLFYKPSIVKQSQANHKRSRSARSTQVSIQRGCVLLMRNDQQPTCVRCHANPQRTAAGGALCRKASQISLLLIKNVYFWK